MSPLASVVPTSEPPAGILWSVHGALVLVQCGYAGANIVAKAALTTGINPIVLAVERDVIAIFTIAPLAYFAERGKRSRLDSTTITLLLLLGIIGLAFHSVPVRFYGDKSEVLTEGVPSEVAGSTAVAAFIFKRLIFGTQLMVLFGLKLATASLSSIISITVPICVFFISAVFGLEDINWRRFDGQAKVGGFICAVGGGVVVAVYEGPAILGALSPGLYNSPGSELQVDGNGSSPVTILDLGIQTWQIGVVLFFLAGLAVSVFISLQVPLLERFPAPLSMAVLSFIVGDLMLAILGLITVQDSSKWVIYHQPSTIISLLYLGVISSGANYALQAWAIQKAGPVLIATYNPLQPFVTSTLALLFLGESIHLGSVLGTLLIIGGLYLITWGKIQGRKLGSLSKEAVPTPDGLPTIKATSSLEEPLLR